VNSPANTALPLHRALERQAAALPNKIFIHHKRESYSYAQVDEMVRSHAGFLRAHGLARGDRVCLMLPRMPELIVAFLAATRIGALPVPVNYLLPAEHITRFVRTMRPGVIVSHDKVVSPFLDDALAGEERLLRIDVSGRMNRWLPWWECFEVSGREGEWEAASEDVAYLNFTTGSSGQPKRALATHANIFWNTRAAVEALALSGDDVHLCMFAAFAHPHELFARPLYTGASLVLLEELSPRTLLEAINRHEVSCLMGLAPMYAMLAAHGGGKEMPSLRVAESGGMYTRPEVNEAFVQTFGQPILSVWGSTETTGIALANTPDEYRTDGSMGCVCPQYQARLIDEAGEEAAPGEIGELCLRGPGVVDSYEGLALPRDREGWYVSGDMARRDETGYYYFAGRKNEMFKVAGLKVHPAQIELILLEHPAVAEAAVVGIQDRRKGMVAKAFLVLRLGQSVAHDDIVDFCRKRMPSYMVPRQIELRDALPKIGSGKINKKLLLPQ